MQTSRLFLNFFHRNSDFRYLDIHHSGNLHVPYGNISINTFLLHNTLLHETEITYSHITIRTISPNGLQSFQPDMIWLCIYLNKNWPDFSWLEFWPQNANFCKWHTGEPNQKLLVQICYTEYIMNIFLAWLITYFTETHFYTPKSMTMSLFTFEIRARARMGASRQ